MEASPAIRSSNGVSPGLAARNASVAVAATARAERLAQPAELPRPPRFNAATLAGLAVAAGVGAIALGVLAFVSSMTADDSNTGARSVAEGALPLLARSTTQRIPFSGAHETLTLVVGVGGRGALVPDGLEEAAPGWRYRAWITGPNGGAPVSAALFSGGEAVVPLSAPVPRGAIVGVTLEPADGSPARSGAPKLVARRSP